MKEHRVQITVWLEPHVLQAAKQRAGEMKVSLSATVAEAAKESLLSSYRSEREQEILKAVERNFHALRRLEQRLGLDIQVLKEMAGLGMRSFFNHTPPIPQASQAAALLSGKQRFHRYLDALAKNLRGGESILSDVPLPELAEPMAAKQEGAAAEPAEHQRSKTVAADTDTQGAVHRASQTENGPNRRRNEGLFEPSQEA
jgi:hypothetical protein